MMMHEEVVQEKDRSVERSQEGMEELEEEIESQKDALRKLELALKEKDQEIADLKMLVDILENRGGSTGFESGEGRNSEVGDIMEEQLKYITEQQMIKDLLEK
jgi:chromosome segregation ATPase